jgi:hypothetical protein
MEKYFREYVANANEEKSGSRRQGGGVGNPAEETFCRQSFASTSTVI